MNLSNFVNTESIEQRGGGVWDSVKSIFYIVCAILSLGLFTYACYILFKCNILGEWTRAFLALSFVILPVIAPVAFLIFDNVKPICRVSLPAVQAQIPVAVSPVGSEL